MFFRPESSLSVSRRILHSLSRELRAEMHRKIDQGQYRLTLFLVRFTKFLGGKMLSMKCVWLAANARLVFLGAILYSQLIKAILEIFGEGRHF